MYLANGGAYDESCGSAHSSTEKRAACVRWKVCERRCVPGSARVALRYQRYDWVQDDLAQWTDLPNDALIVFKGVFCFTAELWNAYTVKIWCRADSMLRLTRCLARHREEARLFIATPFPCRTGYARVTTIPNPATPLRARSHRRRDLKDKQNCMVINRRGVLLAIALAAFGRAARGLTWVGIPEADRSSDFLETQAVHSADARLRNDLSLLAGRVYSEEGIPMVLACENLVPGPSSFVPTALNHMLSSAFIRDTNTYEHMKPEASAADVAKIVEMLADRDFAAGGREKAL